MHSAPTPFALTLDIILFPILIPQFTFNLLFSPYHLCDFYFSPIPNPAVPIGLWPLAPRKPPTFPRLTAWLNEPRHERYA